MTGVEIVAVDHQRLCAIDPHQIAEVTATVGLRKAQVVAADGDQMILLPVIEAVDLLAPKAQHIH